MILTKVQKQFCEKNETTRTTTTQRIQMECHEMCICTTKNFFSSFAKYIYAKTLFSLSSGSSVAQMPVLVLLLKQQKKMKKTF